jgi:uncharacterized protein (DUF4415 family)
MSLALPAGRAAVDHRLSKASRREVRPVRGCFVDESGEVRELTEEDIARFRLVQEVGPGMLAAVSEFRRRGRPPVDNPKVRIGLRLAPDVVESIRATERGFNAGVERVLREALAEGKLWVAQIRAPSGETRPGPVSSLWPRFSHLDRAIEPPRLPAIQPPTDDCYRFPVSLKGFTPLQLGRNVARRLRDDLQRALDRAAEHAVAHAPVAGMGDERADQVDLGENMVEPIGDGGFGHQ